MRYKPSQEDCDRIREAAFSEASPYISAGAVLLEPGLRSGPKPGEDMNILLVTDDPQWNDTDLYDYGTWAAFRKGIDLTPEGKGVVDFYIRKRNDQYGELHGNIIIEIEGGKLVRIYGNKHDYFNIKGGS